MAYENDSNIYTNQDNGQVRSYTKGTKHFVLAQYDVLGGYSVTAHIVKQKVN